MEEVMRIPSIGKTETYDISNTEYATVKLDDSNRFWVGITTKIEEPIPSNKLNVTIKDSEDIWFDSFEEVKEYLAEKSDETHKAQFQDEG